MSEKVRPPAVAGLFYPRDPERLRAEVSELLSAVTEPAGNLPKALIAPHAGYIYSGQTAATSFGMLRDCAQTIKGIVVIGPAHYVPIRGIAVPTVNAFQTPLGSVPVDRQAIESLLDLPFVIRDDRNSGDTAGSRDRVVGYGAWLFEDARGGR